MTGNKSKKGREVPIPSDLAPHLEALASIHAKDRTRPLFDMSRQWVSKVMKDAALKAGIDPGRGPSPCPPAYLRAERRSQRGPHRGPEGVVGAREPRRDGAVRPAGRGASRMGQEAVGAQP